jgi:hypothetical protein
MPFTDVKVSEDSAFIRQFQFSDIENDLKNFIFIPIKI